MEVAEKKPTRWSKALRKLRAERGLTRAQLAEKIGVSVRTLISWETSQYVPGKMALRLIRGAFPDLKP